MADMNEESEHEEDGDHLPGISGISAWAKIIGILALLVVINLVVAFASWGWGVIITFPFTVWLAFLLLRDLIPRHRFPPGRPPRGMPA